MWLVEDLVCRYVGGGRKEPAIEKKTVGEENVREEWEVEWGREWAQTSIDDSDFVCLWIH